MSDDALALLDELRILAQNGLEYAEDPYDEERYERILDLACREYADLTDLSPDAVRERFAEELGHVTPKVGSGAAVFDDEGRILLVRRSDDGTWCLPCGFVDPGESPDETAVRETREETGLDVRPIESVGVYTRHPDERGPHGLVRHVYLCERVGGELGLSRESEAVQYRSIDEVTDWHHEHRASALDARDRWRDHRLETRH